MNKLEDDQQLALAVTQMESDYQNSIVKKSVIAKKKKKKKKKH